MKNAPWKLMLVTHQHDTSLDEYLSFIAVCAASGITSVQLRDKNQNINKLMTTARALKKLLDRFNIPLVVNDCIDVCLNINADGVHLGQTDGDIFYARQVLGKSKIIGLSVDSLEQLETANQLPIDYIGLGAIFPTNNKDNVTNIWGLSGLSKAYAMSKHPLIAIGGINEHNAVNVMQSGANGIAAIGAFHDAINVAAVTRHLRTIVDGVYHALPN